MKQNNPPLWIFFTIILLGCWLIAAPASFHFKSHPLFYSDLICGALLIILGLYGRIKTTTPLLWTIAFVGIYLQFSPLIFWAPTAAGYLNNTLIGTLVVAFSVIFFPMPGQIPDEEPTIPPGWSFNPSSWPQRIPVAFFAFVCWMISRYLSAYQLGYIDTVWDPFFTPGTKGVLESSVSKLFPVSDAGLGAFAYTLEFLSTCQGGKARWRTSPWGVLVFGILVIPVSLVSVILIILQPLVVGTWCTLCLVTAICMLLPIPLALDEVIASIQYLRHSKEKPFFTLLFQGGKCPKATIDTRTPSLTASMKTIYKSSLWGVTFPWNLILCAFVGIALMHINPILGALTTVVCVLSFSEYLRSARRILFLLAFILCISNWDSPLCIGAAVVIAALSMRKGPILESCQYV